MFHRASLATRARRISADRSLITVQEERETQESSAKDE